MIISRTPLRISFTGGGSDMHAFYQEQGGAVISTAIAKYIFVTVNRKFDNGIRIAYSKTEEVTSVAEIEHRLVRAALTQLSIHGGVEITTIADIPSKGTGLGSSSSFTVGLLNALNAYMGKHVSSEYLGRESSRIEIDICGEPIGKQDQYAAAYGGLNLIEFASDDSVNVRPIICKPSTVQALHSHLLMLYTGKTRSASALLANQRQSVQNECASRTTLRRMVELTYDLKRELEHDRPEALGDLLHENWMLKKTLADGISTPEIDEWYAQARTLGARGGKILGAGAGGFLLLFAPPETHEQISNRLQGLRRIPFSFEKFGSQIIFYNPS